MFANNPNFLDIMKSIKQKIISFIIVLRSRVHYLSLLAIAISLVSFNRFFEPPIFSLYESFERYYRPHYTV